MAAIELDVDAIIAKLLSVRGARPGKQVALQESEIRGLCIKSREVFMQQPILLELEAPLKICGACLRRRRRPRCPSPGAVLSRVPPAALTPRRRCTRCFARR